MRYIYRNHPSERDIASNTNPTATAQGINTMPGFHLRSKSVKKSPDATGIKKINTTKTTRSIHHIHPSQQHIASNTEATTTAQAINSSCTCF